MADASEKTRDLLIALNAADSITRGALCRLAIELDRWLAVRGATALRQAAAALGVPLTQLRRAHQVARRAPTLAAAERARAARAGCGILTFGEAGYPSRLVDLALPPPVLYVRGALPDGPAVAVVGARKCDRYGFEVARLFGRSLAAAGITVVSGFAIGVDAAAHRGALAAVSGDAGDAAPADPGTTRGDGVTVAVLGCGVDVDYPRRSRRLADAIAGHGALISEFALGAQPRPWRFPVRNRVIAALGAGTLVVQGRARSGSLNTAHHALELGRDVYAVPGRIFDELALGPNALLADGALVARSPADVIDSLPLAHQLQLFPSRRDARMRPEEPAAPPAPLPPGIPGQILGALPRGDLRSADELAATIAIPVEKVLGALLELELAGRVRREPGNAYSLVAS